MVINQKKFDIKQVGCMKQKNEETVYDGPGLPIINLFGIVEFSQLGYIV
jgi:hypothetical protein